MIFFLLKLFILQLLLLNVILNINVTNSAYPTKTNIDDCAGHPCKNNGTCTDRVKEITDNAVQLTVRSQNFKYEHQDSTHSWRFHNKNNNFYLNVTEWFSRPGGTKRLKPIEEMSKKRTKWFSEEVLRVCEEDRFPNFPVPFALKLTGINS